jgi:hypothetical protein
MIKFFAYDSAENKIIINEPEILLVKEFADLWTNERNICKEDPTGKKKLRGFRELIYIYMAIDWGAPGSKDTPANRHKYALEASQLTDEEYNDPVFKAACRKYQELQNSSSVIGQMVETYQNNIHKMKIFIDSIDYNERTDTGTPVFRIKDTLTEMQNLSKALQSLKELEAQYKEEQDEASGLRGDTSPGLFD